MILTLVATCIISAGMTFTPPDGWVLMRVAFQGWMTPCVGNVCLSIVSVPVKDNTVTMHRTIQVGESATAPEGCQLTLEAKEK